MSGGAGPAPLTARLDFGSAPLSVAPIYIELDAAAPGGARAATDAEAAAQAARYVERADPLAGIRLPWVDRADEATPLGVRLAVALDDVETWAERAEALGLGMPDRTMLYRIAGHTLDALVTPAGRVLSLVVPPAPAGADRAEWGRRYYRDLAATWDADAEAFLAWEAEAAEWMQAAMAARATDELDLFARASAALEAEERARILVEAGLDPGLDVAALPLDVLEDALALIAAHETPRLTGDDPAALAALARLIEASGR